MDSEDPFIPFIHNYCDRWCERCEFTACCSVFAMEAEMSDAEKDVSGEAFVRNLTNILKDAQEMLAEKAAEFGIDLDAVPDPGYLEYRERKRANIRSEELTKLAEQYAFGSRPVLETADGWLTDRVEDDPVVGEMLQILYWYQYFIAAKIQRGLGGIVDTDGDEDQDELRDPQSDANGSIKIALIAIERSILAWTYLLSLENASMVRPQIELLEKIRQLAERTFPIARDFVRPGFDEIEIVM